MHRNLNISTEEGARHPKYDKISHMNQHTLKTEYDKENTHYSYSPTTVSPKKSLECQLHENSPRFTHHQDSFEDSNNVSNNNYAEQYHSKRHSELRDNTQNRRNTVQHNSFSGNNEGFEKVRNCNENDVKLLKQEVIALRRSLNEAQGKTNIISKEFSKLQHENSLFQSQLRRSELKIKELIEGHATDQAKISELTLQRNQLHSEVAKLRTELYDINKAKENVENLKKSLSDVENLIEYKNKKMFKHMKQLNFGLGTLQGIISSSDSPRSDHCQHLFEKLQEIMGNILNVSGCTDLEELNNMQESNGFHTMAKFREAMSEYENENTELKDHIIYLDNLLQKEELKNKELLPQYKESIDKLRKNVVKIKEQLKETQQQRKEDRKQFFEKLHEVEMVNKELMEENMALKAVNEELAEKAKNNEMLVLHNEEKVKQLTKDYKRLEASIKSIQKTNAVSPSYSNLNNKRTPQGESTALAPQKEPRSRSRDYSALNRTLTEGDESFSQNPAPRSSSVARQRVEAPENNQRNHKIYQKPISTDITIGKIYQGCQTFSDNRSQDIGSLNRTFELERAKINHARKNSENRSNHPALPTGKFRGNYESTPHYYIEDNSQIVEDKEALENIEFGRGYFSNQVDRSYSRQARNTSKYERTHKDLSVMTSFGGDLKNEIASLDNEIGEIQKYMLDGLDMEDNN